MGPIDSGGLARGVHLHTALGVTTSGRVIGILDQQYWARPQQGQPAPEEKESGKWINGVDAARDVLYAAAGARPLPRLIHVMDREGDAYEVMMTIVDAGDSAIIRCAQNRRIDDPLNKAHEAVRNQPVLCRKEILVPRKTGIPERHAQVEVRSMQVTLVPDHEKYPHAWPMTWNLVEVWEPEPPPGVESVHWLLWTLEPAATAAEALAVVAEIQVPVADRGSTLGNQERLPGGEFAVGDMGGTGEGCDSQRGSGGADCVAPGSGAGDPRGSGAGGLERG